MFKKACIQLSVYCDRNATAQSGPKQVNTYKMVVLDPTSDMLYQYLICMDHYYKQQLGTSWKKHL